MPPNKYSQFSCEKESLFGGKPNTKHCPTKTAFLVVGVEGFGVLLERFLTTLRLLLSSHR